MNSLQSKTIKHKSETRKRSLNYFFISCLFMILPVMFYGFRPLIIFGISIITCIIAEAVSNLLSNKSFTVDDFSCISIGAINALLLPVTVPIWMPAAAGLFAVWVVKMPLGGIKKPIFNESAAAISFLTVCWPLKMFYYVSASKSIELPLFGDIPAGIESVRSAAASIRLGAVPPQNFIDFLLGRVPGAIGTSLIIMIIAAFIYLCIKNIISARVSLGFIITYIAFIVVLNIRDGNILMNLLYEFSAGGILFYAVFLISDKQIAPKGKRSAIIYGATAAVFMFFMRSYGFYEAGACFVVLLMNAVAPSMEKYLDIYTKEQEELEVYEEEILAAEGISESFKSGFEHVSASMADDMLNISEENETEEIKPVIKKISYEKINPKVRVISKISEDEVKTDETKSDEVVHEEEIITPQEVAIEEYKTEENIEIEEDIEEIMMEDKNSVNTFIKDKLANIKREADKKPEKEKVNLFGKKKNKFEELKNKNININLADPMRMPLDDIELNTASPKIRVLGKDELTKINQTKEKKQAPVLEIDNLPDMTDMLSQKNDIKPIDKPEESLKIESNKNEVKQIKKEVKESLPPVIDKEIKSEIKQDISEVKAEKIKEEKPQAKTDDDIAKMINEHKIRIIKKNEQRKQAEAALKEGKPQDIKNVNSREAKDSLVNYTDNTQEYKSKLDQIKKDLRESKSDAVLDYTTENEYKIRVISKNNTEEAKKEKIQKTDDNYKIRVISKNQSEEYDSVISKKESDKNEDRIDDNGYKIRTISKNDPNMLKEIEESLPKVTIYDQKDRIRVIAVNDEEDVENEYVSIYSKQRILKDSYEKVRIIKKNEIVVEEVVPKPKETTEKIRIISTTKKSADAVILEDSINKEGE